MGELASYQLSDFILFSQSAYFRLFELYNQAIWPLHVVAIFLAIFILYALWKKAVWSGQLIAVILVISWLWVAVAFLYQRFYQIHIIANWYAYGFIIQAGLIAWFGVIKNRFNSRVESQQRVKVGLALLLFVLIAYPFIAFISGRKWIQFEMFALTPDPTALATIAIFLLFKTPKYCYLIPAGWVLISMVTLLVM